MPEIQSVRAAHAVRTLFLVFDKYQVLHVIKLTDQSNLQTYYLKTDAKIAFFAPRRKILLRKHEKQVCKRLRKKVGNAPVSPMCLPKRRNKKRISRKAELKNSYFCKKVEVYFAVSEFCCIFAKTKTIK